VRWVEVRRRGDLASCSQHSDGWCPPAGNTRPHLPGVENRRHLFEPLEPALARGGVSDQVALFIDVQGFRDAPYCHRSVYELNNEIGLVVFTYMLEPSQLGHNRH